MVRQPSSDIFIWYKMSNGKIVQAQCDKKFKSAF